jgi:hypothetical protein
LRKKVVVRAERETGVIVPHQRIGVKADGAILES